MNNFKRYEMKYIFNNDDIIKFKNVLNMYMKLDNHKKHIINNIYLDNESNLLIRRSIDKPNYKEKIRIRFYNKLNYDTNAFIEIKKKFDKIVYKRRVSLNYNDLIEQVNNKFIKSNDQIAKEINYSINFYNVYPKVQLTYAREAYYNESNLRITIDNEIRYKSSDIYNFEKDGIELDNSIYIVEVKTDIGLPMWLLEFFSNNKIYKSSFSKYGEVYKRICEEN